MTQCLLSTRTISRLNSTVVVNDSCATAQAVNLTTQNVTVYGNTCGANADVVPDCGSGGMPDLIYSVNIPPGAQSVNVLISPGFIVEVMSPCGQGSLLACLNGGGSVSRVGPTTLYFSVQMQVPRGGGTGARCGAFRMVLDKRW